MPDLVVFIEGRLAGEITAADEGIVFGQAVFCTGGTTRIFARRSA